MSSRRQSTRAHYSPPRNLGTVARHHGAGSSRTARAKCCRHVAVRHHVPRRYRARDFQNVLDKIGWASFNVSWLLVHDEDRRTHRSPDESSIMIVLRSGPPTTENFLLDALPYRRKMLWHNGFAHAWCRESTCVGDRFAENDGALVEMASDGNWKREIHC